MELVERFRRQARACAELGSPLYGTLLDRAADDLAHGGAIADVMAGHEAAPPGSAMALRLTGAVHRLVLQRRAPTLALHYPSVGGRYEPGSGRTDDALWAAFVDTIVEHHDEVREGLTRPPQTNEPGRALPLLGALAVVSRRTEVDRVHLVEIGASAGLNLRADALTGLFAAGDLARASQARPYAVVRRTGGDIDPIDPTGPEGRLTLTSYVWPDDSVRLARLKAAFEVARQIPVTVRRAGAAELLADVDVQDGLVTVLWHSVMWQYVPSEEQAAVLAQRDRLAARASLTAPFAHVSFEPPDDPRSAFVVSLRWSAGRTARPPVEHLGVAPPHGVPVRWYLPAGG